MTNQDLKAIIEHILKKRELVHCKMKLHILKTE